MLLVLSLIFSSCKKENLNELQPIDNNTKSTDSIVIKPVNTVVYDSIKILKINIGMSYTQVKNILLDTTYTFDTIIKTNPIDTLINHNDTTILKIDTLINRISHFVQVDTIMTDIIYCRNADNMSVVYLFSGTILKEIYIRDIFYNFNDDYNTYINTFYSYIKSNYCLYLPTPDYNSEYFINLQDSTKQITMGIDHLNLDGVPVNTCYFELEKLN